MLRTRFNTAYYLCKYEKSYSDFEDLLNLEEKNGMKKSTAYRNDRAAATFVDVIGRETTINLHNKLIHTIINPLKVYI